MFSTQSPQVENPSFPQLSPSGTCVVMARCSLFLRVAARPGVEHLVVSLLAMGLLFSKALSRWFSQSVLQESFMYGVFESCAGFILVSFYFYFVPFPDSSYFGASLGFPGGSVGKESSCNAGDPGTIPG